MMIAGRRADHDAAACPSPEPASASEPRPLPGGSAPAAKTVTSPRSSAAGLFTRLTSPPIGEPPKRARARGGNHFADE
eukprot:2671482-Rhodomonas_salina.2